VVWAVAERYGAAGRLEKGRILDDFRPSAASSPFGDNPQRSAEPLRLEAPLQLRAVTKAYGPLRVEPLKIRFVDFRTASRKARLAFSLGGGLLGEEIDASRVAARPR
jgi:hypothetical protein